MSELKVYDPDQVLVFFSGIVLSGYAEGEFISAEQMSEAFQSVVGTDGDVTRSKSNDRRVRVTVKLMQSSESNALLSGIHNADLRGPNGAGIGTFEMNDLNGGTLIHGDKAWIVGFPPNSMDRTAKSREWVIEIADADRFEGGN